MNEAASNRPRQTRFSVLDIYRFAAALDFFFVLSGFVIAHGIIISASLRQIRCGVLVGTLCFVSAVAGMMVGLNLWGDNRAFLLHCLFYGRGRSVRLATTVKNPFCRVPRRYFLFGLSSARARAVDFVRTSLEAFHCRFRSAAVFAPG
jgi:hypothetical protein